MTFGTDATSEGSSEVQPAGEEHPPLPADLYCPDCGYNLRGLTSRRCPECGLALDFLESETPIIPWERRRELGRFRAYWQTVLMVMFRNKLFCRAFYQPISDGDARSFRRLSILQAWLSTLLAFVAFWSFESDAAAGLVRFLGAWFVAYIYACFFLFLCAVTAWPGAVFASLVQTNEQRSRAVALGRYACAGLVWMLPALIVFLLSLPLRRLYPTAGEIGLASAGGLAFIALGWSSSEPTRVAKRIFRAKRSKWALQFQVEIMWAVCVVAFLFVLPLGAWFVYLVVYSLL